MADGQHLSPRAGSLDLFLPLNPRFLGIIDSDALLPTIDNHTRTLRPTFINRIGTAGTFRLLAADHIYDETYARLGNFAKPEGPSYNVLRARYENDYLPLLRFVTVTEDLVEDDPQVLAVTHDADVPTAILAKLVAPSQVFSGDKHLRRPGIAPKDWRSIARAGAAVTEGDEFKAGASVVVAGSSFGLIELVRAIARWLDVSPWMVALAFGLIGSVVFKDPKRRTKLKGALESTGRQMVDGITRIWEAEQQGLRTIQGIAVLPPATPTLEQAVARALAVAREPLSVAEVLENVIRSSPNLKATDKGIRIVLGSHEAFTHPVRGRWQLGRRRAPRGA